MPGPKYSTGSRSVSKFLYILPFMILLAVFAYYPLYGWVYAFFDYMPPIPLSKSPFVGFRWFHYLVENQVKIDQLLQVVKNTFGISGLSILFSWLPMIFAIFLTEIKAVRFRKFIQTVTTLPNFISWVLVYSLAFTMFSSEGIVNGFLHQLGLADSPILFLQSSEHVWITQWVWITWKTLGWSAILYIAAIMGIDESLYEAAYVDGATRMQVIRHVVLPSMLPTYFVLLMLQIASFLNNGLEQYFVFQNAFNKESIQVLDLYVYNLAMGGGSYSVSVAISMLKSLISVVLLFSVNGLSKLLRGEGIV
ncbi:putative aldouronate transport system permease protein [Paenibacillus sp. PastF-1]|uniref:ABC transporter permease subunit n=2 Tax=unclassified Paenibacillus TaxID=185978 RepID=UPI0024762183|nr:MULTISPECIES: ABC transporter permease subunit [unclassified Paenibacillus]MDF9843680.1 putative aldouronate transport system permease protein [Paenibacillus sp. PastF-2]MDF9850268.1 putative aldouronate transport system permease protein [Paenibacillus sp. PastM-2]MDF9856792.1 putative aldouronate transport system permease protein [Paenibacillus sp. PastF-1]MDH6482115.1 putative aldouronate transport system permease protein [Paenibacillus sp. PastH-2]MDH6509537.1 putative aldouronate transp